MASPIHCNPLLGQLRVNSLEQLMAAYRDSNHELRDGIDGGAGAGVLTAQMLEYSTGTIHAFEPFPGNHRFHEDHSRVKFYKSALAEAASVGQFYVSSTISPDSPWSQSLSGYSSVGYLLDEFKSMKAENAPSEKLCEVPCVSADEVIPEYCPVDVVKLDLQGGELNALLGMPRIISKAEFLWVEYTAQRDLAAMLVDHGFLLFDTEYFFMGAPTAEIQSRFTISNPEMMLSTGAKACFGFAKDVPLENYEEWFKSMRQELNMVQTDLVCVHRDRLDSFVAALGCINTD